MSRTPLLEITADEERALRLCAQGLTNKAIAHEMGVSKSTARNHLVRLALLLNAPNRVGVVVRAHQHGLIDLDTIQVKRRVVKC